MRKIRLNLILCFLGIVLGAGQGAAAEPLQPLTIRLNWVPNVEFAGILVAKEQGLYVEAGIELTITPWAVGIEPIDEVVAGRAQIGVQDGSRIIEASAAKKPVKAIAAIYQRTPVCLIGKRGQGIQTLEQLKGKRIGINAPETELTVKIMLANQGIPANEVTFVQRGWELQPLIEDRVDVIVGFMNNEPLLLKEKGIDVSYIPAFKYGYDFYSGVYFVNETSLREKPALMQKFLDVTLRGWREAFKDPAAAAKLIVAQYYPNGSVTQQTESLKVFQMLATVGIGENLLGYMEESFWAKGVDILYNYKQIDRKIPAQDVFTLDLLKKTGAAK